MPAGIDKTDDDIYVDLNLVPGAEDEYTIKYNTSGPGTKPSYRNFYKPEQRFVYTALKHLGWSAERTKVAFEVKNANIGTRVPPQIVRVIEDRFRDGTPEKKDYLKDVMRKDAGLEEFVRSCDRPEKLLPEALEVTWRGQTDLRAIVMSSEGMQDFDKYKAAKDQEAGAGASGGQ